MSVMYLKSLLFSLHMIFSHEADQAEAVMTKANVDIVTGKQIGRAHV